jgi:hypothetical protein
LWIYNLQEHNTNDIDKNRKLPSGCLTGTPAGKVHIVPSTRGDDEEGLIKRYQHILKLLCVIWIAN